MKYIKLLLVSLLLFSAVGCSNNSKSQDSENNEEVQEDSGESTIIREDGTYEKNGIEFTVYEGIEYPSILGTSQLSDDEIASLDDLSSYLSINDYGDYLTYVKNKTYESSMDMVNNTYFLLYGDYDELGAIYAFVSGNPVALLCLKTDGKYYPIDVFNYSDSWLANYSVDQYCFDTTDEMLEALKTEDFSGITYSSFCDSNYFKGYIPYVIINGEKADTYIKFGTQVYDYVGTQIPVHLGLPEYTDDEIRAMIDSGDYSSVASKIHTLADAINYIKRAGFKSESNSGHHSYQNISYVDVGNLKYSDDSTFMYVASGLELLHLKYGQCTAMSTLFSYLLKDDYKELGYVLTNHHMMIYIVGDDDKYYLIDPATYVEYTVGKNEVVTDLRKEWCPYYSSASACCDTLSELMSEFINSPLKPQDPGSALNFLITYTYDGIGCRQIFTADYNPSNFALPTGARGQVWYGNIELYYTDPVHSTDQEYVIGLSSEGAIFNNY